MNVRKTIPGEPVSSRAPLTEEQVAKAVALLRPNWAAICEAERQARSADPAEQTAGAA